MNKNNRNIYKTLNADEVNTARLWWVKINQKILKQASDFETLKQHMSIKEDKNSDRINEAKLPYETKKPIILTRKHRLVELTILDCHESVHHDGERETLAEFRSMYWTKGGKNVVKSILKLCQLCKCLNSRTYEYPRMPCLPKIRLRDDYAFSGIGADYMGPLCKIIFLQLIQWEKRICLNVMLYCIPAHQREVLFWT